MPQPLMRAPLRRGLGPRGHVQPHACRLRVLAHAQGAPAGTPPPHPRRLHPTHAASTPPTPPPHPTPRHIRSQARFAAEIKARCELLELAPSADYRRALAAAAEPSFFTPLDERAAAAVEARFAQLSRGAAVPTRAAVSFGRTMPLLACDAAGVARLSFEEACGGHYGAADYIALAQAYHTLVLTNASVPGPSGGCVGAR